MVNYKELEMLSGELLMAYGLNRNDASIITNCFLEADLCGVSTHGLSILPSHLKRISSGGYNLNPDLIRIVNTSALSVIDADNAIGVLSAYHCMNVAIEGCKKSGIYTVFCRNANTYGPAFYYAEMASKQKLIGITFCNSPPAMPVHNGLEKMLGTNPFAVAFPANKHDDIVFDMATSKVAKSKINEARLAGENIPDDWALDENGNPTVNPLEAIKGLILPMAGFKGYGLAMTIDIIAGLLSGAEFLNGVNKFYSENNKCMNVGQVFITMDPKIIYGESFCEDMDCYIEKIRSSKNNGSAIAIPGEDRCSMRKNSIKYGMVSGDRILNTLKWELSHTKGELQ